MTIPQTPTSEADRILFYLKDHKFFVLDKSTTDEEEDALERLQHMSMIEKNNKGHFVLTRRGNYCAKNNGIKSPAHGFYQQNRHEKLKRDRILSFKKKIKKLLYDPWTIAVGSGIILYLIIS